MTQFSDLCLSPTMLEAIEDMGYTQPTPIQEQAIPLVLGGRDIIAGAQTGTGKTAAFCLPTMDTLPHAPKHGGPLMLVITPTRELADQIEEVCSQIAKRTKHKVTKVVGGVSYNPQRTALQRGTDILIATPGRLEDLIGQDVAKLDQVQVVILDEADRMLDMGFLPSIERIMDTCTTDRQTLLFSATIDENVTKVARKMLRDPEQIEIAHRGDTAQNVEQFIVKISHAAKPEALKAIFEEHGANRVIVFARTRHRADTCARKLKRAGYKVDTIHSDRSQNQRRKALAAFDKGEVNVLVATDVLARGIDIDQVDYVVNYDMPTQPEDYVHRIGRTGRAGASGFAVSLVSPETRSELKAVQKLIGMKLPEMELPGLDVETAEQMAQAKAERYAQENAEQGKSGAKKKGKGKKKAKKSASAPAVNEAPAASEDAAEKPAGKGKGRGKKQAGKGRKGSGAAESKRGGKQGNRGERSDENGGNKPSGKSRKGDKPGKGFDGKRGGGRFNDDARDNRDNNGKRNGRNTGKGRKGAGNNDQRNDGFKPKRGRKGGNAGSGYGKGRKGGYGRQQNAADKPKRGKFSPGRYSSGMHR